MPAAISRLKPALRIIGIVNVPVVAVLATALPESEPIRPLESTATFAGPPTLLRNSRRASSTIACGRPGRLEHGAEEHEEEHVGEHHPQRDAEDALAMEEGLRRQSLEPVAAVRQQPDGSDAPKKP